MNEDTYSPPVEVPINPYAETGAINVAMRDMWDASDYGSVAGNVMSDMVARDAMLDRPVVAPVEAWHGPSDTALVDGGWQYGMSSALGRIGHGVSDAWDSATLSMEQLGDHASGRLSQGAEWFIGPTRVTQDAIAQLKATQERQGPWASAVQDVALGAAVLPAAYMAGPLLTYSKTPLNTLQKVGLGAHRLAAAQQLASVPGNLAAIRRMFTGDNPWDRLAAGEVTQVSPEDLAYINDKLYNNPTVGGSLVKGASGAGVSGEPLVKGLPSEVGHYQYVGDANDVAEFFRNFAETHRMQKLAGTNPWAARPLIRNVGINGVEAGISVLSRHVVKSRVPGIIAGWLGESVQKGLTDGRSALTAQQIEALRDLAAKAAPYPQSSRRW